MGRADELKSITDCLVANRHIAVVGAGGMGKSSLALAAINCEQVVRKYSRRYFVRLDKAETDAAVISEVHRYDN